MHHHKSKRIKKDGRYYYEPWNPFDMDVSLDPDGANWTELAKDHDLELLNDAIILYPTLKMKKKKAHAVLREVRPTGVEENLIYISEVRQALNDWKDVELALLGELAILEGNLSNRRAETYLLKQRIFGEGSSKKDDGNDVTRARASFDRKFRKLDIDGDLDMMSTEKRGSRRGGEEEEEEEEEESDGD